MRRLLAHLSDLYMVDLCCDEAVVPFYERLGLQRWDAGMGIRNRDVLRDNTGPNQGVQSDQEGSDPESGTTW